MSPDRSSSPLKARPDIVELIRSAPRLTLVIHQQPDGDALGSAAGLAAALEQAGKEAIVVCATPVAPIFSKLLADLGCRRSLPDQPGLIVLIDCSESHRSGFGRQLKKLIASQPLAVIDHHPGGDLARLTNYCHQEVGAASTAELIYEYLNALRLPLTPTIATSLLLGIYTDTGGFQHANTTSRTLNLASRLV